MKLPLLLSFFLGFLYEEVELTPLHRSKRNLLTDMMSGVADIGASIFGFDETERIFKKKEKYKHHSSYKEEPYIYELFPADSYHDDTPYHDDLEVKEKKTFWNGNIVIPNFIPSMMDSLGYGKNTGYGEDDRVVVGIDKKLGLRVAVPFFGDFQYIRSFGPGRYTEPLGPGEFPYSGLSEAAQMDQASAGIHQPLLKVPVVDHIAFENVKGLQNYPWYSK